MKENSPLQIADMKKIMVKPHAWRLLSWPDGFYSLKFTYVVPERNEWAPVYTARGDLKLYRSPTAALSDIKRVQGSSVIYYD